MPLQAIHGSEAARSYTETNSKREDQQAVSPSRFGDKIRITFDRRPCHYKPYMVLKQPDPTQRQTARGRINRQFHQVVSAIKSALPLTGDHAITSHTWF